MKNLILILLMAFVHSASAQNDSILPNVFAAFDVQDTYMNPDLNIWTSKYRFVKTDVYSGQTMGKDTLVVEATDFYDHTLFPIAHIALDSSRAYIKRHTHPLSDYGHFSPHFGDDWELLYDFSLNVGDTACNHYDMPPDEPFAPPWTVLQVDTLYIQGEVRRVLKVGYPPGNVQDTWIQGMGSIMGPLAPKLRYFELTRKLCGAAMMYNGPSPVDSNFYSVSCSITSTSDAEPKKFLRIFPNPANERIALSVDGRLPGHVTVRDGLGRVIRHSVLREGVTEFSVSGFAPGMYFFQVTFRDGTVATAKVLKE